MLACPSSSAERLRWIFARRSRSDTGTDQTKKSARVPAPIISGSIMPRPYAACKRTGFTSPDIAD